MDRQHVRATGRVIGRQRRRGTDRGVGPLRRTAIGPAWAFGLALGALALSALWRWPLGWVVLGVGGVGMVLAWRRLPP